MFGTRRGKRALPRDEGDRFDEEEWPLHDVIFVEDVKVQPFGEVLAVDGNQVSRRQLDGCKIKAKTVSVQDRKKY